MADRVVIIDIGYPSYEYESKVLNRAGYGLDVFEGKAKDREGKIGFAGNAVGIFCQLTRIDAEFFDAVPRLKAVVRYGVGYDSVDLDAATQRGIKVANVKGFANHSVSDHALALMFACARAVPRGQTLFRNEFGKPPRGELFEFHDKTLGIIGLGPTGGTLCQKAKGLFKRVLATDPYVPDERFFELGAEKVDLNTLVAESHVITIHCNLTQETTHLINTHIFNRMKQRPILVNTARGGVVDELALVKALNKAQVHSAGLDVFSSEPPPADLSELLDHPHVVATGHYAWYSDAAIKELQRRAAENMLMLLQGQIPDDCLNP